MIWIQVLTLSCLMASVLTNNIKETKNRYETNEINQYPHRGNNINSNKKRPLKDTIKPRKSVPKLKSYPPKDVEYTVHGVEANNKDTDNMSPEDKSKHGCMDTMKRTHNERTPMSKQEMESACAMYTQWGTSMRKERKWKPTEGQMSWWKSLGNGMKKARSSETQRFSRQSGSGQAIRKEYRMMTDEERHNFHESLQHLKAATMDGESKYDIFVNFHQGNVAPGAHFGPGFLGYHRELLHRPPGSMYPPPYMGYGRMPPRMMPPPVPPYAPVPYWYHMRFFKF